MEPIFFASTVEFRAWLEANHETATELWVGFYKKASGKPSMTWSEAVDQALCFGWIDGVRRSVSADGYANRFTPRTPKSNWSNVNIAKVQALTAQGLMMPAGLRAFEQRDAARSGVYSFEKRPEGLPPEYEARFKEQSAAWAFFEQQPPGYRRLAAHWVTSAMREETRLKRLATLIEDSANGRRIGLLARPADRKRE